MNGTGELFYRQLPLLERSYRVATYSLRDDAESVDVLAADLAAHRRGRRAGRTPRDYRRRVIRRRGGADLCPDPSGDATALVILNSFSHFAPQFHLKLAIAGLTTLPWRAMSLVRHLTAFRLHSRHTQRAEVKRFIQLTARATRAGYINRLRLLQRYDVRDRLHDIRSPDAVSGRRTRPSRAFRLSGALHGRTRAFERHADPRRPWTYLPDRPEPGPVADSRRMAARFTRRSRPGVTVACLLPEATRLIVRARAQDGHEGGPGASRRSRRTCPLESAISK